MNHWFRFEQRWRDAVLDAVIPVGPETSGIVSLSLDDFWSEFGVHAPSLLRLGFRLAVWFVTLTPLLTGYWRRFHRLEPDRREACLLGMYASRVWLVRQLIETLKVIACFAYFRDPSVRAQFALLPRQNVDVAWVPANKDAA